MKYSELKGLTILGKLNYLVKHYDNSYTLIATYILQFEDEYKKLTLKRIAHNVYVSTTTVERFVKVLGYEKFSDFKYNLIFELENNYSNKRTYNNNEYFQDLHKSLDSTLSLIDEQQLQQFSSKLINCHTICIVGIGSSYLIALDLSYKLERMGINARAVSDPNLIYFNSCLAEEGHLFIGITYSGKSRIINDALHKAYIGGATTAVITSVANQNEYNNVDYKLFVEAEDNLIRTNSSSARIVMLALVDAIHTEILKSPKRELFLANIEKTKLLN